MASMKKCVKIVPLNQNSRLKCGVCDEFLVIPPIYSCLSVKYICGPCFEGFRYYLDNDDLRGDDRPIRQILYENYACRIRFPCSFYPYCRGVMDFDKGAKVHYSEYCMANFLSIFKCPISRAHRWFLRPTQRFCQERFRGRILFENENLNLISHLKTCHSEYLLDKPYILHFRNLKADLRQRQLFLLLLEENNIVAVITTEITRNDLVFRCRVNDSVDLKSQEADPFECYVSLWPPHERFSKSIVNLKFGCVQFDCEDIEYPWQSLRLPLRHLMDETAFKIYIAPRSHLLSCLPFILRDRQLCCEEDCTSRSSEATTLALSNPESAKTEIELLSFPSTNSDNQPTSEFDKSAPEIWGMDTSIEIQDESPNKLDDGIFLGVDDVYEENQELNTKQLQEKGDLPTNRKLFIDRVTLECTPSEYIPPEQEITALMSFLTPDTSIGEDTEGKTSPEEIESYEKNIERSSWLDMIEPVSKSMVPTSENIPDSDRSPQDNYHHNEISIEHNYSKTICMNSQEYKLSTSKLERDHSKAHQIQEKIKSTSDNSILFTNAPEETTPDQELKDSESSSNPTILSDDPPELTPIFISKQYEDEIKRTSPLKNLNDCREVIEENFPQDTFNEIIIGEEINEEETLLRMMAKTALDEEIILTEQKYSNEYTAIEEIGREYSTVDVLEKITNVCDNKENMQSGLVCFCMECKGKKNRK